MLHVVERDPRTCFTLVRGPSGERWLRDRDRLGWGLDLAYSRWTPEEEVARLRCLQRYENCSDAWLRGDLKGMVLAMAGTPPLVVLGGGKDR